MKSVVFADGKLGCVGLLSLLKSKAQIAALFTLTDDNKDSGGTRKLHQIAAEHNIPVYAPDNINHPLWIAQIADINPDYLFTLDFPILPSNRLVQIARKGSFNLHASLLPKYKGLTPVHWAILSGESEIGVSFQQIEEKPYSGQILGQCKIENQPEDDFETIIEKLAHEVRGFLGDILPQLLDGNITPLPPVSGAVEEIRPHIRSISTAIPWQKTARSVCDHIRSLTSLNNLPYSYFRQLEIQVLKARESKTPVPVGTNPGTVLATSPLTIACGNGAIEILFAKEKDKIPVGGEQLSRQLNLRSDTQLQAVADLPASQRRKKRVLILGINGFIGNALSGRLLADGNYEVHGMDINSDAIERFMDHPDFYYHEGDIAINSEWIEYHVKKCDIVLPLVAIATPIEYTRNPLKVFELDFEENLKIVRACVKYKKRVIFPSTSEVYGMCDDSSFDEDRSNLVLGPINKQRWIYSCSKQLLDRVIWAYGVKHDLDFTLFRPFNWMGPRLDTLDSARIGNSRAITQLILNLVEGTPILLIDGGEQKRCFTDVRDGVECLFRIIENKEHVSSGEIINIGNPDNEYSIKELAEMLYEKFEQHPLRHHFPAFAGFKLIESRTYYGDGYEDVQRRRPSIQNAQRLLEWSPTVSMSDTMSRTLDYFLRDHLSTDQNFESKQGVL